MGCRCGCMAAPATGSADGRRMNSMCIFCRRISMSGTRHSSIFSAPSFNVGDLSLAERVVERERADDMREHRIAQRQLGEMAVCVQDIGRVVARLADSGAYIFKNCVERQLAGILDVPPVD